MIEEKARKVLRAEMSKKLEKGRMKEVMPKDDEEGARKVVQLDKRLREIAKIGANNYLMRSGMHELRVERGAEFWAARVLWGLPRGRRKV